jgi:hypothetical protein
MDAYERFHQLLKRDYSPLLRAEGFKGSGTTFRRIKDEVIHVVNVQGSRHGGECCVNLGLHYSFLPTAGGCPVIDPKRLKEYECDFRDRIHEVHESDHWWRYGATEAEAEASVASLVEMYRIWGVSFFKKFEPFPEVFERITPAEMDAGDLSRFPTPMTLVHAALTMARIMRHLRRFEISRQFADVGLRHLGHAIGLRTELERLRDAADQTLPDK